MKQNEFLEIIEQNKGKHRPSLETLIQGRNGGVYYNPYVPSLPNNVIKYEASAKLSETTNPESSGIHTNAFNTTMVSHTFENGVGTIEFEDDVTILGDWAFGFTNITKITIPNSVITVNWHAFVFCTNLTSITIPNSVTSIDIWAFNYCSGLASITIDSNNTVYDSRDDCNAIIDTATNTLIIGCKNTIIPNTVTSIGNDAFGNLNSLTSITIPDSVTSIGDEAFHNCTGLTSVTVEATTPPTLGSNTFGNNASGRKIYVPAASIETYKAASGWSTYAADIQAIH